MSKQASDTKSPEPCTHIWNCRVCFQEKICKSTCLHYKSETSEDKEEDVTF